MRRDGTSAGGLLVFLVYGMFALFSLLLVVIGAGIYRGVVETGRENTQLRSSLLYLANQMRSCSGDARLEGEPEAPVLVLPMQQGEYETRIYFEDGALCEYYGPAGETPAAGLGERVAALDDFSIGQAGNGLFEVTVTAGGEVRSMALCGTA